MIKQLTLIGVGLIGGSFVLDLKQRGLVQTVVGVDVNAQNLRDALALGVIDCAESEISAQSVGDADLVLLATPMATLPEICRQLAQFLPSEVIISDVGSTKMSAMSAFMQFLPNHLAHCVAAHPIAGSDKSGAVSAHTGLFKQKKVILCPHNNQSSGSLKKMETLWQAVGAQVYELSAEEHDKVMAAVSHLPHLFAFAYVHQMLDNPQGAGYLQFAGSGFRDFTRIAASHPQMWTDITLENRDNLLKLLSEHLAQLAYLQTCLHNQDVEKLYRYFAEAKQVREIWGQSH